MACGAGRQTPVEISRQIESPGGPVVALRVVVQPEHRDKAERYVVAAAATIRACVESVGGFGGGSLTVLDPPWHGRAVAAAANDIVLAPTPWWELPPAMTLELNVARSIARRCWADAIDSPDAPSWFIDGLAEFTARRVAVPLFNARALPGGYAVLETRYFGGFVPRLIPVRLYPDTDGDPLPFYRRQPNVDPTRAGSRDEQRSLTAKTVLMLGTLERWIGRPGFDAALSAFATEAHGRSATLDTFTATVSAVSGQDVSWLVRPAVTTPAVIDYAVTRLESASDPDGSYRSTVVVARLGDGRFTGTAALPAGPFESGRGVVLRTTFRDGSIRDDTWDGRSESKTFVYGSAQPIVSAEVDPDHTILLDVNPGNNGRTLTPRGGAVAASWAARWWLWLQGVLLTYGSLV